MRERRCLRLGSYGLTIDGPIGHAWYKLLDKYVYPNDPQCNAAVLLKTAADQIAWAPVMTCVYFAFLRTLEGHPELIVSTIQVCMCFCKPCTGQPASPCMPAVPLKTPVGEAFLPAVTFTATTKLPAQWCLCAVQSKVVATVVANYCLWPAAHYINFKYVPSEHRWAAVFTSTPMQLTN